MRAGGAGWQPAQNLPLAPCRQVRGIGHICLLVLALRYLPLVSSKTLKGVALLDARMNTVGWAPVDGF